MRFAAAPLIASLALLAIPVSALAAGPGNNPSGPNSGNESAYGYTGGNQGQNENRGGPGGFANNGYNGSNQGFNGGYGPNPNGYANNGFNGYGNQNSFNNGYSNNGFAGNTQFGNPQFGNQQSEMNGNNGEFNQQNAQGVSSDTRQRIRDALEAKGFHNIQVLPEAFVIRAQAPDGSRVVMEVSPEAIEGVVMNNGNPGNNDYDNQAINQGPGMENGQWHNQNEGTGNNGGR